MHNITKPRSVIATLAMGCLLLLALFFMATVEPLYFWTWFFPPICLLFAACMVWDSPADFPGPPGRLLLQIFPVAIIGYVAVLGCWALGRLLLYSLHSFFHILLGIG